MSAGWPVNRFFPDPPATTEPGQHWAPTDRGQVPATLCGLATFNGFHQLPEQATDGKFAVCRPELTAVEIARLVTCPACLAALPADRVLP